MNDTLDSILEIDPGIQQTTELPTDVAVVDVPTDVAILDPEPPIEVNEKFEEDFEHTRKNIKELVDLGRRAAEEALELAESGDSPRAYEVVGALIGNIVNASKELVNIHKVRKDTISTPEGMKIGTVNHIDKAVFVGRASELLRELKSISEGIKKA